MTDQPTVTSTSVDNTEIVKSFLEALQAQDFDTFASLVADDIVYENVGLPTIRGGQRVTKLMRGMEGKVGFEVKFHRNVTEGLTVLNERTDAIVWGRLRLQFWVCGVFEVSDGRVTLWRDYFDFFDMTKALVRGVIGMVIPSVQRTM